MQVKGHLILKDYKLSISQQNSLAVSITYILNLKYITGQQILISHAVKSLTNTLRPPLGPSGNLSLSAPHTAS